MDVNRLQNTDIQFVQAQKNGNTGLSASSGKPAEFPNIGKPSGTEGVSVREFDDKITASDKKLTSDFLEKMIDQANKNLFGSNREFNFSVHEKTGQFMIKIIDTETKEIVREIPPEKTLDAVAKMWELAGILLDEKK